MSHPDFSDVSVCVFDAYGTLFDVHSAVGRYRERLGDEADAISLVWRTKQLEYTWLRSLMDRFVDFWQITQDGLDFAMEAHGVRDDELRRQLLDAYLALDCYPEVPEVLSRLRERGLRTAVLSNGSREMLDAAVASANLGELLDAVLSVDEVGVFKPDARVYSLALDRLGVTPVQVSFQSSNAWDAAGAATFGLRVAWCNRFGQQRERLPDGPHAEIGNLTQLLALLPERRQA
ncbi:MAG: haloacid dehalogenase type II [Gammaproteobacteria bacterium]